MLLSTGEQVSCALISGALNELGIKAQSFMNWQIPILTDGENNNSRIINMNTTKINDYIANGGVAIIPGYQGISKLGEVTTIGRGGSDATAVAIAKIFDTDSCEIYTDVDGFTPQILIKSLLQRKLIKYLTRKCELSSLGAKVMQKSSAVQTAMIYDILFRLDLHLLIVQEQKFF